MGPLEFFVPLKPCFLDLHQVKVICYRRYLMHYCNKEPYWIAWANCCIKNHKIIKNIFYQKRLSVFGGVPFTTLNTLFSAKCFINFVGAYEKMHLHYFKFFYKKMLILFHNVLCNCKAFNNNGNKWILLDVILKKHSF